MFRAFFGLMLILCGLGGILAEFSKDQDHTAGLFLIIIFLVPGIWSFRSGQKVMIKMDLSASQRWLYTVTPLFYFVRKVQGRFFPEEYKKQEQKRRLKKMSTEEKEDYIQDLVMERALKVAEKIKKENALKEKREIQLEVLQEITDLPKIELEKIEQRVRKSVENSVKMK